MAMQCQTEPFTISSCETPVAMKKSETHNFLEILGGLHWCPWVLKTAIFLNGSLPAVFVGDW